MRITLEGDDRQTLIARLGLSTDASDADITQAVTARILAESAPPSPPEPPEQPDPNREQPPGSADPEGGDNNGDNDPPDSDDVEVVDAAAYRALVARAGQADALEEQARIKDRDDLIAKAIRAGKFPPSRKKHYTERYDSDPDATRTAIERMASNVVPVKERGVDPSEQEMEASDAYPMEWLNGSTPQASSPNGTGGQQPRRQSRIQMED